VGVVKAYSTRVGAGPFPTEIAEENSFADARLAREYGTTTGRKRRMGWFDAVMARRAVVLSGASTLALMKLDILDQAKTIQICTGYRNNGIVNLQPPCLIDDWYRVEPVYETMPGWEQATKMSRSFHDLPAAAQKYVRRIEELLETPIGLISVGPGREQTIIVDKQYEFSFS
jgi:adenylosuccinate synthase